MAACACPPGCAITVSRELLLTGMLRALCMQLFMQEMPFAGHQHWHWGGGLMLDQSMDLYDWLRELAALPYYWAKGYIAPLASWLKPPP